MDTSYYYFSIANGEGYQVTEKWVFFKLLFQSYKQTHLGVRITERHINFVCEAEGQIGNVQLGPLAIKQEVEQTTEGPRHLDVTAQVFLGQTMNSLFLVVVVMVVVVGV